MKRDIVRRYGHNPILTKAEIPYPVETVHNAAVVKQGSRFRSRRTLWDFNRLWFGSCWQKKHLWGDRQSGAHLSSHDAKAPDGLIVTRDRSFFKTYCYLIASLESSLSLASCTRKRPPQSGFVQTGIWETTPAKSASIR
jgi:hypothetical protein